MKAFCKKLFTLLCPLLKSKFVNIKVLYLVNVLYASFRAGP